MTTTPDQPLGDDDIQTVGSTDPDLGTPTVGDGTDGTDGNDADGTDGSDADGTDGSDGTDGGSVDADGTDA
ncbi:MAG: hypothetical protein ACR2KG_01105 [Nocardioidaceae bacterium]